jgi:hypothetical protein
MAYLGSRTVTRCSERSWASYLCAVPRISWPPAESADGETEGFPDPRGRTRWDSR